MAKTGRPKAQRVVSDEERGELLRSTRRAHVDRHVAFRARLVFLTPLPALQKPNLIENEGMEDEALGHIGRIQWA